MKRVIILILVITTGFLWAQQSKPKPKPVKSEIIQPEPIAPANKFFTDATESIEKRIETVSVWFLYYEDADGTKYDVIRVYPEGGEAQAKEDKTLLESQPCGRYYGVRKAVYYVPIHLRK